VEEVPGAAVSRCNMVCEQTPPGTHSITSSARRRIAVGSSIPIAWAVFIFTTISNFVGCSMGKLAG
jgi:hypothetical protein